MNYGRVVGIDIGSSTVKVMAGTILEDHTVVVSGVGTVPLAGMEKGNVTDKAAFCLAIKNAMDCVSVATDDNFQNAFIGISNTAINSVNASGTVAPVLPDNIAEGDIHRACTAAAMGFVPEDHQVLHILPQGFRVDGETLFVMPIGRAGSCLEVAAHIVTIPRSLSDVIKSAAEAAGVNLLGIYANSITGSRTLVPPEEQSNTLVFDIGAEITDIVLYHKGSVFFSAELPLGGNYITSDIMQGLEVKKEYAEEIKRTYGKIDKTILTPGGIIDLSSYGVVEKQVTYEFLNNIVECRVEEIARILYEYLTPVVSQFSTEKILLTGGSAALPSFAEWFAKFFSVPVSVVFPEQLVEEYADTSYTASFGLLSQGAKERVDSSDKKENTQQRTFFSKIRNLFNI